MKAMANSNNILEVENLIKNYGAQNVLRDVSLSLSKGDIKIVIGPSGAGKSTLLHCINFLTTVDSGQIELRNQKINYHHKRELYAYRQKIGMIFQDFNLFDHLTALENVQIGLVRVKKIPKRKALKMATEELNRVGLGEHVEKYPAELSGGQKQRVSIARALAMEPEIMLLDEPTSSLDPELTGEVLSVIRDLASGGMTMLMATHQIEFAASLADEIIFMENGVNVEQGPANKVLFDADCDRTREFCARIRGLDKGISQ
jgi:polar amino acid transport system ATP-binding protein